VSATGLYPNGIGIDQATNTVLVASGTDNTVSVIDGATCDATVHTGCTQTPSTIAVGNGPEGIDVDVATDTAYVANVYSENLSVLNLRTCDATHTSGCGQVPPTMSIGGYSFRGVAVDQLTNTIYVQSVTESAVDVLDGRTCNSLVTSGCAQTPRLVSTGGWPVNEAIDEATGTVYVPSNVDGQVAIISAR
jgi:DNA-binding beta-propeller fold protein YncE